MSVIILESLAVLSLESGSFAGSQDRDCPRFAACDKERCNPLKGYRPDKALKASWTALSNEGMSSFTVSQTILSSTRW